MLLLRWTILISAICLGPAMFAQQADRFAGARREMEQRYNAWRKEHDRVDGAFATGIAAISRLKPAESPDAAAWCSQPHEDNIEALRALFAGQNHAQNTYFSLHAEDAKNSTREMKTLVEAQRELADRNKTDRAEAEKELAFLQQQRAQLVGSANSFPIAPSASTANVNGSNGVANQAPSGKMPAAPSGSPAAANGGKGEIANPESQDKKGEARGAQTPSATAGSLPTGAVNNGGALDQKRPSTGDDSGSKVELNKAIAELDKAIQLRQNKIAILRNTDERRKTTYDSLDDVRSDLESRRQEAEDSISLLATQQQYWEAYYTMRKAQYLQKCKVGLMRGPMGGLDK